MELNEESEVHARYSYRRPEFQFRYHPFLRGFVIQSLINLEKMLKKNKTKSKSPFEETRPLEYLQRIVFTLGITVQTSMVPNELQTVMLKYMGIPEIIEVVRDPDTPKWRQERILTLKTIEILKYLLQ